MAIEFSKLLNKEQYEAVTTTDGPLLIIAGAGTGKTRVITYRAAYMIENGIVPEQILMLTFTNKAAAEMKKRVNSLTGDAAERLTVCTYHSFCAMMLRKYGRSVGLDPNFTILSSGDDVDVINLVKSGSNKYEKRGFPPSAKIASIISTSINKDISIGCVLGYEGFDRFKNFRKDIEEIKALSDAYKRANSMVNYDDILLYMDRLLSTCSAVKNRICETYQYIMVDEYQDTNPLQERILFAMQGSEKNIAVVGDDMQSLYGFRGADVRNILEFSERMHGCKTVYLTTNYRSHQKILDLSNCIVKHASEGFPKELHGLTESGEKPVLYYPETQHDETDMIIKKIMDLRRCENVPYKEMCVLARNSASTAPLELALVKSNIGYVKYGGKKYFDLEYVKDVIAYARVLTNPMDELAWFRILQVHAGIGQTYAMQIADECRKNGTDALLSDKYKRRIFKNELRLLHEHLSKALSDNGRDMTNLMGSLVEFYVKTKRRNINTMRTSEDKRTMYLIELEAQAKNLMPLSDIASRYTSLVKLTDDLMLDNTSLSHVDAGETEVVLSTIHSVKGLEFDTVFIMDCAEGVFPSVDEKDRGTTKDDEELRCFYVAVTRAKKRLYMYCPELVMKWGSAIMGVRPHYLDGGEQCFEEVS